MLIKLLPITAIVVLIAISGCQTSHEVTIKQDEPLTINMNIRLEVSEEIIALLRAEKQQSNASSNQKSMTKSLSLAPASPFQIVEQLKSAHKVGETLNGYLASVNSTLKPLENDLIEQTNQQRKNDYKNLSNQKNITLSDVETIAGKQRIEKELPERMVMNGAGQFVVKTQ